MPGRPLLWPGRRAALHRVLRGAGQLVLLLGAPQLARGAAILAVRVWPARDYTRVTIESDQPLSASHQMVQGPDRLVVDIDGLELNAALRELVGQVRPDDPYIQGVRVGQFQPRVVRLVFDLKQPVLPQQFALAPVAAYQQRLVLDLYPVQETDPLLALLREREDQRSTPGGADALGELIARIERPVPVAAPSTPAPGGPAPARPSPQTPQAPASAAAPSMPGFVPAPAAPPFAPPLLAPPTASERQRVARLIIIALDPGHGGEDPGAIGPTGLREKDVVLAIGLALRKRLNAEPGMRVMMTRDADFFVPHHERVRKAQRVQADLFVSIHADAFFRREARGASVYALSTRGASSSAARWMAERENAADQVGGVNIAGVKDGQVLRAMADMSTTAQIKQSLSFGSEVLRRIGTVGSLHKRQVEQAGFAVLKAPDIPSILVETAFISNPEEESKLRDPAFRAELVEALAAGISSYIARNPPLARQRQL